MFLRLIVLVRVCLLWGVVRVVGAAAGKINLPQLHSHTGGDLHGGVSELMATCAAMALALAARARWFFWSEDADPEVVDLSFLSDFVDGR